MGTVIFQDAMLKVFMTASVEAVVKLVAPRAHSKGLALETAIAPEVPRLVLGELVAASDLALRLMGLFVDDSTYRVDERTGSLRVRLTKYKAS